MRHGPRPGSSFRSILLRRCCQSIPSRHFPPRAIFGRLVIGPTEMPDTSGFLVSGCCLLGRAFFGLRGIGDLPEAFTDGARDTGVRMSGFMEGSTMDSAMAESASWVANGVAVFSLIT